MLKVKDEKDQILVAKAFEAGQEHIFDFWKELSREQQRGLLGQVAQIDFQLLDKLERIRRGDTTTFSRDVAKPPVLEPPELIELPRTPAQEKERADAEAAGRDALEKGRVAVFVVAGGQGTRLGWDAPKGTYPVGPVTQKSLFQLFAEQIVALGRKVKRELPWFVMTSSGNRAETETFFKEHGFFGLVAANVKFVIQRDLPVVDLNGKLLMAEKHEIAMSPDGHGGALRALREGGAFDEMNRRGCDTLFYFQVDNPLCKIADPIFVGHHLRKTAEASTKIVKKVDPAEKVGLVAKKDGRITIVEYSEIDDAHRLQREPSGDLRFRAGNTAIHVFDRAFLERMAGPGSKLEYHIAKKAVPFVDRKGQPVAPKEPNAVKWEMFIFDILGEARNHVTLEVNRDEEFEPLKNGGGPVYSPETVRGAISARSARWLEAAGVPIKKDEQGRPVGKFEVSPLTALGPDDLKKKLAKQKPEPKDGALAV